MIKNNNITKEHQRICTDQCLQFGDILIETKQHIQFQLKGSISGTRFEEFNQHYIKGVKNEQFLEMQTFKVEPKIIKWSTVHPYQYGHHTKGFSPYIFNQGLPLHYLYTNSN